MLNIYLLMEVGENGSVAKAKLGFYKSTKLAVLSLRYAYALDIYYGNEECCILKKIDMLIVGAPKLNGQGGVFGCDVTTRKSDCNLLQFEEEPYPEQDRTDQWLGVTVRSQGPGGQVLTCAHRTVTVGINSRSGLGLCYTLTPSLDFDSEWTPCEGRSTAKAHEEFGYCQAGTHAAFTENNELLIGSPGPYTWRGTVFSRSIETSIVADKLWYHGPLDSNPPVDKYSYLGMAVTSGQFDDKIFSFIAGAPRSNGSGQVIFFEKKVAQPTLNVQFKLTGDTFASSFGYELATIDINGDKKLDLVVGAPFYYGKESGGAIYIYMNAQLQAIYKDLNENTQPIRMTGKPESRYGFAITNLKDLNKDGFEDLAVGAPYENRGVIYIYLGSAEGIKKEPSQIILSENIPGLPIQTFGYSLSGGMDIDHNGYPDLLVGAYESDRVVLIRSRPVINIETKIEGSLINIDPNRAGCADDNQAGTVCFAFETCFKLSSQHSAASARYVEVVYQLVAETFGTKKFSRVRLRGGSDSDNNKIDTLIRLNRNEWTTFKCRKEVAYLKENTIDILNPIAFKVTYSLRQEKPVQEVEGSALLDINGYPILNQQKASRIFQATFAKDCGDNDICESDLRTLVKLNLRNNEFTLGKEKEITLNVSVQNFHESAYEAFVYIQHSGNLSYVGSKSDQNQHPCSPTTVKTVISCSLGNPFKATEKPTEIMLRFSPASIGDYEEQLTFIVHSNSTSDDKTNEGPHTRTVKVIRKVELEIIGGQRQEQVFYGGEIKGESAIKYEDEVGTHVEHNYLIKNSGPWKVSTITVNILWPYEVENKKAHGKWLLYMIEAPTLEDSPGICSIDPSRVNPLNLQRRYDAQTLDFDHDEISTKPTPNEENQDNSLSRNKREAVVQPETVEIDGKKSVIVNMDCKTGTAKCFSFQCYLWNLDVNRHGVIKIRARLWNSTFVEDYPTVDWVAIKSWASLEIKQTNIKEENLSDNEAYVETRAYPLDIPGVAKSQEVPLWIIIVAACAGLLLLIIIVLILWRLGFFRRKKHEAMMKGNLEKHPNDVDGAY
ncbi:hypothetical protein CHUAL_007394 [Chamberlinius hualienensis]